MSPTSQTGGLSQNIHEAGKFLAEWTKNASQHEETRKALLAIYGKEIAALESPLEVIWRMMMEVS